MIVLLAAAQLAILAPIPEFRSLRHSSNTAQGGWVSVEFQPSPKISAPFALEFLNRSVPCYLRDDVWECLAAVPADSKTGIQKLKLRSGKKRFFSARVMVAEGRFPTEPLTLTSEKKALLNAKDRKEEVQRIRAALKTETGERLWSESFALPLEGKVESSYGERRTVDGKLRKGYHRGVDWYAPEGTDVRAANRGRVVLAGPFAEEGNMVMVDHGQGILSAYLHLSSILAQEGKTVERGEVIGKSGETGVANTPHLHFGLYLHGTPIDPVLWLARPAPAPGR